MHDIRAIRDNPDAFDAGLKLRGGEPVAAQLIALDAAKRAAETALQEALARRNDASKAIGAAKAKKDEAQAQRLMAEVASLKTEVPALETATREGEAALDELLAALPNLPAAEVPPGADETRNVEQHRKGLLRNFDFTPQEHDAIGPALGLDFESAQKVSGARFAYLRGDLARLARALGQFMLDLHTGEFEYQEVAPPLLVRDEALFGTGQLPKFESDLFETRIPLDVDLVDAQIRENISERRNEKQNAVLDDDFWEKLHEDVMGSVRDAHRTSKFSRRWLIPTAEVSLTNIVRESILGEAELPLRFTALTPCFRSEAGAAGRDTRGYIRQHQFDKVELVSITTPEASDAEHERMTQCAEAVLERLRLPYRRMLLCAGDMGFTARRTFDLEVWLPGQGAWREISSCSTCGDFQARRMNARYRPEGEKGTRFVHTLNGSGLAVGRTLVAVIENCQNADGSVTIPEKLRPWMGGREAIVPQ
jgi:seryl-tRNA synthetase